MQEVWAVTIDGRSHERVEYGVFVGQCRKRCVVHDRDRLVTVGQSAHGPLVTVGTLFCSDPATQTWTRGDTMSHTMTTA